MEFLRSSLGLHYVATDTIADAVGSALVSKEKEMLSRFDEEKAAWTRRLDIIRDEHSKHVESVARQQAQAFKAEKKQALVAQEDKLREEARKDRVKAVKAKEHEYNLERVERYGDIEEMRGRVGLFQKALEGFSQYHQQSNQVHRMAVAASLVASSLNRSLPLSVPYVQLVKLAGDNEVVETVLPTIEEKSLERGVETHASLMQRFPKVVDAARHAALVPEDSGLWGELLAMATNFLTIRSVHSTQGDSVNSVLTRAENCARGGDVVAAIAELEKLEGKPGQVVRSWVSDARRRATAQLALDMVQAEATAVSASFAEGR